ncbi:MAG: hypothetical protein GXP55_23350 [Deltaproteobacteria bacterium]|nr:hypothetical protein [Deltaproteobacteria bacterium]
MTRQSAKAAERAALELLMAKVDIGVDVAHIVTREAPDFVLELSDGSCVGVEVVELADEAIANGMGSYGHLKRGVRERLEDRGIKVGICLSAHTERLAEMAGASWKPEADGIVRLARGHVDAECRDHTYEGAALDGYGVHYLDSVSMSASDEPWVGTGAHGPGRRLVAQAHRHVVNKNAKLPKYRANVDGPIWLVLVGGGRLASGTWSVMIRDLTFRSDFDRTFYVDHSDSTAFEVSTTAS